MGAQQILLIDDHVAAAQWERDLYRLGVVRRVNIGGLHEREGRRRRLPYVFLSDSEGESLKMLEADGIEVTARDVPSAKAVPLSEFL